MNFIKANSKRIGLFVAAVVIAGLGFFIPGSVQLACSIVPVVCQSSEQPAQ